MTSEPFSVAKGGQPFYVYPLSDWGYPPYGNSIICMADTIRKRPAAVAAFVIHGRLEKLPAGSRPRQQPDR